MGILDSLSDNILSNLSGGIKELSSKDIVQNILNTNWDFSDSFDIEFTNTFALDRGMFLPKDEDLSKSVISVEVPTFSSQEIDTVLGGMRRPQVRLYELFRFVIRFRDFDGGKLRETFLKLFIAQQYQYVDVVGSNINIKHNGRLLFNTEKALITNISSQIFDNSNSGISEFEVTFISSDFTNEEIKGFGSDGNYADSFTDN
jgi:hypothetical protein